MDLALHDPILAKNKNNAPMEHKGVYLHFYQNVLLTFRCEYEKPEINPIK